MKMDKLFKEDCKNWLVDQIDGLTHKIHRLSPSEHTELTRYMPSSVTSRPGYFRYSTTPYMREIADCFDVRSPVREVNLMKGVQVGYTTVLENILLYVMDHVKTQPCMFMTADGELAKSRIENSITPMIVMSGKQDIIKSSDPHNLRKSGKALCVNTIIPTLYGDRRMGDLSVGDLIFSIDGTPTKITAESPIHEKESYEVVFANGEKIIASDDHRWTVCVHGNTSPDVILTTKELFNSGIKHKNDYRYRVRVVKPVLYDRQDLEIEPYTLGAWLGDGNSRLARITAGDDADEILKQIKMDGYTLIKSVSKDRCDTYNICVHDDFKYNIGYGFKVKLDSYNLVKNKHIPDIYLRSSIEQRIRLLQGLMDTDGHVSKKGECEIVQKNKKLAYDIWRLVNSLGIKATLQDKIARSQNGTSSDVYRVKFFAEKNDKPFTIQRKLDRVKDKLTSRSMKNSIVQINPVGVRIVKCISVDHSSNLFLCGGGYIPTHNTDKHIQWKGGGYMVPFGANNANKMRMFSIQWLLKDELDGWPDIVGHDGEPDALSDARCSAYWERRKIFRGSTPLEAHRSKIATAFKRGDQRYYYVRCLHCSFPQVLRWHGVNKKTGHTYGITWEMDGEQLLIESVRWVCEECGHAHREHDKSLLFAESSGAEWRPTAIPRLKDIRSYHLSALYSPDGFQPWYKCVSSYLEGWDVEKKILKNSGKFQEFYNNVLGETYTVLGDRLTFSTVSALRRPAYMLGDIPNEHAIEFGGGKIEMVIMTVDMHKTNLTVATFGFTPKKCCYLLDYWRFTGDTLNTQNPETWGELRKLIEGKVYTDYEGRKFPIALTLIDSSYSTGIVNEFCAGYLHQSVYPIMGREEPPKRAANREFWAFDTNAGITGYGIIVDIYKDTLSMALRRYWDGVEQQPHGFFNAPVDTPDKVIKELTAESRREKKDPLTLKVIGAEWHRPSGRDNELWDLLVYARCGLDMCAADIWHSDVHLGADKKTPTDWSAVWDYIIANTIYHIPAGK